ncbi:MAG: peptidoglycan DD-metalloendopeptidase family protein [Pseudomonadota bacterium]
MASRILHPGAAFLLAGCLLAGCEAAVNLDRFGGGAPTQNTAQTGIRPAADANGIISYPNYQVAVASSGDTVGTVAGRIGLPAGELAAFNGLPEGATLREGEVLVLPRKVAVAGAAGGITSAVIEPAPGSVDISAIAGPAIDQAEATTPSQARTVTAGPEPIRHRVNQGETAFTIARLYNISPQALAEWNGLGPNFDVRTGQILLVPVSADSLPQRTETLAGDGLGGGEAAAATAAGAGAATAVSAPGAGSATPTPPSATRPLPDPEEVATPEVPAQSDRSAEQTAASDTARLLLPVQGSIFRAFQKGTNDGIDISAAAGAPVAAADAGTVAAITRDTEDVPILVLRHADGLLTVYAGIDDISVSRGDSVQRGQQIARVRDADPPFLHFETRQGFESVDPMDFLN